MTLLPKITLAPHGHACCTLFFSIADVVPVSVPLLTVIVNVNVPFGVDEVCTVSVEEPELVIDAGLKLKVAPAGNPLALKVSVPLRPVVAGTVTV